MLSWPELGSSTIVSVAFSADGRLCLTQGGAPEWKLVLWTAEKVSHAKGGGGTRYVFNDGGVDRTQPILMESGGSTGRRGR